MRIRASVPFSAAAAFALLSTLVSRAEAAPSLRQQVDVFGDFVLIGNTLGQECGNNAPAPVKGFVQCGNNNNGDTAPDVFWVSDFAGDPGFLGIGAIPAGPAALHRNTAAQANSVAVLALPAGANVVYARLYWGAALAQANADYDHDVTIGRPGGAGFSQSLNADSGSTVQAENGVTWYQSSADVTTLVQLNGAGAYRVSGVASRDLVDIDDETSFAGWSLVVFYDGVGTTKRNLALFDGFDIVDNGAPASATFSGFTVPDAGFDAKLGVIAYEGDDSIAGDGLTFNGVGLTDALNPVDNFFNGTRSSFGTAVSVAGDLPQETGGRRSMSGIDLDVVDIHTAVKAKDTSATFTATSTQDRYVLGGFITSISTFKPDFSSAAKSVKNETHPSGQAAAGDVLTYTITLQNTGNDASIDTILTDTLPAGVTYKPGTISVDQGKGPATMTDPSDNDIAHYDAGTNAIVVYLGDGAVDPTKGGRMAIGDGATVTFQVTINANFHGVINNQGVITASGQMGSPTEDTPTDGDSSQPGQQPTGVEIPGCSTSADCAGLLCDTASGTCVTCLGNADCADPNPICDPTTHACVGCATDTDCAGAKGLCDPTSHVCVECEASSDCRGVESVCDPTDHTCVGCTPTDLSGCPTGDLCDAGNRTCVECESAADCKDPTKPICSPSGTCVQCVDDTVCTGGNICSTATGTCVAPTDTDGDGLPDAVEISIGTDPNDADTDDDGVKDGDEKEPNVDSDDDGLINALDPDSDNDGIYDGTELGKDCSAAGTDASKHHCIPDADPSTTTDPTNADTDGGGARDGSEDWNLNGKLDAGETDPTTGHAADDSTVVDTDKDGLGDQLEGFLHSDPTSADSDGDGLPDGEEPNPADDTDGDGLANVLDVDSDNDALYDGTEAGKGCPNGGAHCIADADAGATKTSVVVADTDKGGVKDGSEDFNRNGRVDPGETDPTVGHGADDGMVVDSDKDGLSDGLETSIGTDPNNPDTDGDGVPDGQEANVADDTDGDGKVNGNDPDSDGDGLFDGTEMGLTCPAGASATCISDADPTTKTSPVNPDTDFGGEKDGDEDTNHDGKVDPGEKNPLDPSDDNPTGAGGSGGTGQGGNGQGGTGQGGTGQGGNGQGGNGQGGNGNGGNGNGGNPTMGGNGSGGKAGNGNGGNGQGANGQGGNGNGGKSGAAGNGQGGNGNGGNGQGANGQGGNGNGTAGNANGDGNPVDGANLYYEGGCSTDERGGDPWALGLIGLAALAAKRRKKS